jgi:hypothetical protein
MGSKNYGAGLSGYLDPTNRAWENPVFISGKPVLDKELNLEADLSMGDGQTALKTVMPSGWVDPNFLNTSVTASYFVSSVLPEELKLTSGLLAHVNGWLIPVSYTNSNDGTNKLDLGTAPVGAGTSRTDFVVLEVWRKLVLPDPSTAGKSPTGLIWWNGNVKIDPAIDAVQNYPDDIKDITLGSESTRRVQVQYRLRVIQGVDLFSFPYGMEDPVVVAHSVPPAAATPDGVATLFTYANQSANGDQGLWVAGDGNPTNTLGTVDGYMYAIPLCAVFRRNSTAFDRNTNHNGGVATPGPSDRPDGLFYDIFDQRDVADLRLGVTPTGWNYSEVLSKNLGVLLDNNLRSDWVLTPHGGGNEGHTVLWADEIGITNANGGDGVITGDTPGAEFIGQFDATRRFFSDRHHVETVLIKLTPPGPNWAPGDLVSINPTAMEIYPYSAFNWAAYNPADVLFTDVVDAYWIGSAVQMTVDAKPYLRLIENLGSMPVVSVDLTLTSGALPVGLTNEPLYVTLQVSYPSGNGLSKTPTDWYDPDSFYVNNPAQLPAGAPVNFSALATTNTIDAPHREVQLQYTTTNIVLNMAAVQAGPPVNFFILPERANTLVTVLKNGLPIAGTANLDTTGRTAFFSNVLDYTSAGDTLTVTYTALRPLPQNNEQLTIYYEARAPQTARSTLLGLSMALVPKYIDSKVHMLSVGSGSQDEAYPYPIAHVQLGGIYPTSLGTFNGDHELAGRGEVSITDFNASTGYLELPAFIGYVPNAEEVVFDRLLTDTDIEGRTFFKSVPLLAYQPNAYGQNLSDAKRHRNFVPMLAELSVDGPLGFKGQLVLVLLIREAIFDANNAVFFNPALTANTTVASVYRLKSNLLNKRA